MEKLCHDSFMCAMTHSYDIYIYIAAIEKLPPGDAMEKLTYQMQTEREMILFIGKQKGRSSMISNDSFIRDMRPYTYIAHIYIHTYMYIHTLIYIYIHK